MVYDPITPKYITICVIKPMDLTDIKLAGFFHPPNTMRRNPNSLGGASLPSDSTVTQLCDSSVNPITG